MKPGARQEPEADFSADLVRSMQCGLITVDASGRILSLNDRAAAILEVNAGEVIQSPATRALAAHPGLARLLGQALSLETLPDRAEIEVHRNEHERRTIGFTLSRVVGTDGSVRGAALFFKDLTPIEQEEEQERLKERLASLGSMAASLAHEIRNPLAAMEVTTTLLRRKLGGKAREAELAETLQAQVRRLSGIVNNCLEFVRPLALARAAADVASLMDEAIEAAAPAEIAPRVRVVRDYPSEPRPIPVDASAMRQAFLNLVRNALEAMAEKGGVLRCVVQVPLDTGQAGPIRCAVVRVVDSGPGIPEEIRHRVFNPFFSTKPQGSGLGLAWTRKVIDAHGGVLDLESRSGRGATFTIRLPLPNLAAEPGIVPAGDFLHEAQDSGR